MELFQPLRVLIVGEQSNFHHVLSTNIQHWGYDVLYASSLLMREKVQKEQQSTDTLAEWQPDVILYDLDDVNDFTRLHTSADVLPPISKDKKQFLIALSSHSISRRTLEQIGAVALLQKPFEMGRLLRYLRVLQQLLYSCGEQTPNDASDKRIRILVVDDDVNIASVIRQCLTTEAETVFDVAVAYDGLDALEQFLQWHPNCIVTDLIMPLMNGYQVIRCLTVGVAQLTPAFVIMSALTQIEAPVDASYLTGKPIAYVDKPFQIDALLAAIQQVCLIVQPDTNAVC